MPTHRNKILLLIAYLTFAVLATGQNSLVAQLEEVAQQEQQAKDDKQDGESAEEKEEAEGPITDTKDQVNEAPIVGDQYIRFHMWDGSILGGDVSNSTITVATDFGPLQIPIKRILKFHPGIESLPELKSKIDELVAGLGDKDFDVREKSHRQLARMGPSIRNLLDEYDDGGSAEIKKHMAEIKAEIDEVMDEMEEDENGELERSLIRGDLIVTPDFSIVGKIQEGKFDVQSKFGKLDVQLSDIRMANREFQALKDEVKKSVDIDALVFFQKSPKSTRIRVNKGDRIRIDASGSVVWTNWSNTSTPDGLANQGQYQGINCGTLCARIGSSGKIIKVGSDGDFTATRSGILYLAIAMKDNYANSTSYRWTGKYKTKIRVTPAPNN